MAKWENFTAERVAAFTCETGKTQSIYWDGKTPGLGLRVTPSNARSYIFETRMHGKTIRTTIGDIRTWPIGKAQAEATRLKALTDQGIDPRELERAKIDAKAAAATAIAAAKDYTLANLYEAYCAHLEAACKKALHVLHAVSSILTPLHHFKRSQPRTYQQKKLRTCSAASQRRARSAPLALLGHI